MYAPFARRRATASVASCAVAAVIKHVSPRTQSKDALPLAFQLPPLHALHHEVDRNLLDRVGARHTLATRMLATPSARRRSHLEHAASSAAVARCCEFRA